MSSLLILTLDLSPKINWILFIFREEFIFKNFTF